MQKSNPKLKELTKLFAEVLFLGLTDRESDIITGRYGIGKSHQTLSALGRNYGLSRERVRQIEVEIKKKLKKNIETNHSKEFQDLSLIIVDKSGILSEKRLNQLLSELEDEHQNLIKLLLDLNEDLSRLKNHSHIKNGWINKDFDLKKSIGLLESAIDYLDKLGTTAKVNQLLSRISQDRELSEIELIRLLESAHQIIITKKGEYGLITNRRINPKTIGDKINFVLLEAKKPMHFKEIGKAIRDSKFDQKNINRSTVHNELIANPDFVLVGRGLYALKKWGYSEGTIQDVIIRFLNNQEKPQSLSSILNFISKQRVVKKNTVTVNLTKSTKIAKNAKGEYYLR